MDNTTQTDDDLRIMRQAEVLETLGVSRTTLAVLRKSGDFPEAIRLHGRMIGWLRGDVRAWIDSRAHA